MKSFQAQPTMWATDWLVTKRTTRSPTPPQSTLLLHFCPSTRTTLRLQTLQWASAAPPHQETPSLLLHTPLLSLSTPLYQVSPLLPREWQRTLFPKSSTSEATSVKQHGSNQNDFLEKIFWGKEKNTINFTGLWGNVSALLRTRTIKVLLLDFELRPVWKRFLSFFLF